MKVNCLSCGHNIDLDESYGDYEGAIKCYACGAIVEVKLSEERVKSVKLLERTGRAATEVENKLEA
jgi:DNA-directed RNA polymerase subunit N (RpoN/RPB10)